MNPKILVLNITKDINKLFLINFAALMMFLTVVFVIGVYDKKEFVLLTSSAAIGSLTLNLLVAKIVRRKMEKIIHNSFEKKLKISSILMS